MVTITSRIVINIFQVEQFWAVKFAMGYEENMSFLFVEFVEENMSFLFVEFWFRRLQKSWKKMDRLL